MVLYFIDSCGSANYVDNITLYTTGITMADVISSLKAYPKMLLFI